VVLDPATAVTIGALNVGALLVPKLGRYIPKTITYAIIGMEQVGKSTTRAMLKTGLTEVLATVNETTDMESRADRIKVHIEGAMKEDWSFRGMDRPGYRPGRELVVKDQIELKPDIIFVAMDTVNWNHDYNWMVLEELSLNLNDPAYKKATTPLFPFYWPTTLNPFKLLVKSGWTKKYFLNPARCKLIVLMVNKMDLWAQYGREVRKEKIEAVLQHYIKSPEFRTCRSCFKRVPADHKLCNNCAARLPQGNPMDFLRNAYEFHFAATSVKYARYLPFDSLDGNERPIRELWKLLVDRVITLGEHGI
jgi:hypothetical protein